MTICKDYALGVTWRGTDRDGQTDRRAERHTEAEGQDDLQEKM